MANSDSPALDNRKRSTEMENPKMKHLGHCQWGFCGGWESRDGNSTVLKEFWVLLLQVRNLELLRKDSPELVPE